MAGSPNSNPTSPPDAPVTSPAAPPNPWALAKDRDLRATLIKLQQRLGLGAFQLSQRRCEHEGAIVLCKPDQPEVLAWLYTFGQDEGRFGLHLEYPQFKDAPPVAADIHEDLTLDRVADLLRIHFDIV